MPNWWTGLRFLGGGVLAIAALWGASELLDPVYPATRASMAAFGERRAQVTVVTVGNSHSRAISFAALGMPGVHFWLDGQDAFESAFLARYAAERAPGLRYVLLTASYDFYRHDNRMPSQVDRSGPRREIYARTPTLGYLPGDFDLWAGAKLAPVVRPDHWRGVARRLLRPSVPVRDPVTGWDHRPSPVPSGEWLAGYGLMRATQQHAGVKEALREPAIPGRVLASIESLARDLRGRGAYLVLYTPPYHETFRRHFPDADHDLRRVLTPLLQRNPNAVWLDFSADTAITAHREFFHNSSHLSSRGAQLFSARLAASLRRLSSPGIPPGGPCRRGTEQGASPCPSVSPREPSVAFDRRPPLGGEPRQ
ncbi:MAG TPA: hypothetical protein VF613_05705 [Longimicrobium sp.]|jgi:hypothetical protein